MNTKTIVIVAIVLVVAYFGYTYYEKMKAQKGKEANASDVKVPDLNTKPKSAMSFSGDNSLKGLGL